MDKNGPSKKCFCARCFLPVDSDEKVDIEGQNFHRICSMCCVCRTIPTSLKMFYGHVFCGECFKTHVLSRFRGEMPRDQQHQSWWMQWGPDGQCGSSDSKEKKEEEAQSSKNPPKDDAPKRCICARCLQMIDADENVHIGGQAFHTQCAKCYCCHKMPSSSLKIYYGQVFCEECFNKHILNREKDNPSEFYRCCFENWNKNPQFAEQMRQFLSGNKDATPYIFMQGSQPFCRCGNGPQDWFQPNEPKKSATPLAPMSVDESIGTWELSFENRTETSDGQRSLLEDDAKKMEKLTKYLQEHEYDYGGNDKKWKNFVGGGELKMKFVGWINIQGKVKERKGAECPKCLWQCGVIYVDSGKLSNKMLCCGET